MARWLLLLITALTLPAWAERLPLRLVTLEWEGIEGARYYDVEIQVKRPNGKTGPLRTILTREPQWSGRLRPGYYLLRVRGKDHRRVPGEWSEPMEVTVHLEKPKMKSPAEGFKHQSKDPREDDLQFTWERVPGAKTYVLSLTSENDSFKDSFTTRDLEKKVTLPAGQKIRWSLQAIGEQELTSESPAEGTVEVWGPALEKPTLRPPENPFVREVQWEGSEWDRFYQVRVDRWDESIKKWRNVHFEKEHKEARLSLPAEWQGGRYRLAVKAGSPYRETSKYNVISFPVAHGDRSPAAEYRATLLESIKRTKGWFFVASYLITNLEYQGFNSDNYGGRALRVSLPSNLGGTGRLGIGYLPASTPWGFLAMADLTGFIINDLNPRYPSMEINAVRRNEMGALGELRQQFGVSYREFPEIIAENLNRIDRVDSIGSLGLHYGVEYWWALTPKLGFQVNAHAYPNLMSVKTPNGNPVKPSVSYQLGLLGSYRLGTRTTGLMGYAYRSDTQTYESNKGDTNSIEISGHYLNLFLEWAL